MPIDVPYWITAGGLLLDVLGVALIWTYGLPEPLSRTGAVHLVLEQTDEAERAKAARYEVLSRLGLGLVIAGFMLQLIAHLVSN